ncbi:hypothetical protein FRC03_010908 [Tulasnella sp. 419]|nr:hypothetical protein FRC03_010908 [Tulasnella sp. 419]
MATTNILLTQILRTTSNATSIPQAPAMGSSNAVRVNALFFTSLCCSLLTAFGAVLGKQWLNEYERAGRQRSSYGRGMRRHEKLVGMKQYRLELVVEILPTILQLSLFLFLIALVDYLWALSHVIAFIAIACFGLSLFLYGGATVSSLYDSSSPFTTRFSAMLKAKISKIIPRRRTIDEEVARYRATEQAGQCVAWLRDNATSFLSVSTMAKAATLLPSRLRTSLELDAKSIGPSLLRSIISNNAIQLGAVNGSLSSTVSVLHDVLADWVPLQLSVLTETIIHQLHSTIRWTITNDPSSSELIIKVLEKFAYAGDSTPLDLDLLMTYLQILSLDNDGRRAGLKLLWTSMQDPNSDKPRDWPFIKDFRLISKILRYTMWLDGRFTVVDRDEGRFHVRRLWLFKIKPYADRPWARHWLHQFTSRSFITPDMNPALCGIQALSRIVTKVHPNQSEEINSIISQTSLLFGSNFEG